MSNKVKFGIKNGYIAVRKEADGTVTYDTPIKLPGMRSISLEAQGELTKFYADDMVYYTSSSNNGYEGDVEVAMIPDEIRKAILGEVEDEKKVLLENTNAATVTFALLFEIEGDVKGTRFVFYNCTMTRPTVESETTEDTKEPGTETFTLSAAPEADGLVRAKTTADTDETTYNGWFTSVYKSTGAVEAAMAKASAKARTA